VATISRMLKNIGLFCKRDLKKRPIFCKETYIFKHPTHRQSHRNTYFLHTSRGGIHIPKFNYSNSRIVVQNSIIRIREFLRIIQIIRIEFFNNFKIRIFRSCENHKISYFAFSDVQNTTKQFDLTGAAMSFCVRMTETETGNNLFPQWTE